MTDADARVSALQFDVANALAILRAAIEPEQLGECTTLDTAAREVVRELAERVGGFCPSCDSARAVAVGGANLSGLPAPRPLSTWWPPSDPRSARATDLVER